MARFDLTDFEWSVIQPLLANKPRRVARVDDRPRRKVFELVKAAGPKDAGDYPGSDLHGIDELKGKAVVPSDVLQ